MSSFFNMDNGFFVVLGKICDIFFLSIIWLVFCIPIITIGPANTALYYATVKVLRRERGYIFREFFKSFKLNFKRAAIIGVIITAFFVILLLDIYAAWADLSGNSNVSSIMFGIYMAMTFFVLTISIYIFPILSRFDMTVRQLFKTACFMALRHLPFTLIMLIVTVVALVGMYVVPLLTFITPVALTLINSLLMERIFKKYMPKSNENEENSKDEWYLE